MFTRFLSKISFWVFAATLILLTGLLFSEAQRFVVWGQITSPYTPTLAGVEGDYGERAIVEYEVISKRFFKLGTIHDLEQRMAQVHFPEETLSAPSQLPFLQRIAHKPRVSLVAPVVHVSANTGLHLNTLFTIVVYLLLFFTAYNICLVAQRYSGPAVSDSLPYLFLGLVVLSMFMNGRMSYSFFAGSLILNLLTSSRAAIPNWKIILLAMGALFAASVSTGVFAISYVTILGFALFMIFRGKKEISMALALPLIFWSVWFASALYKNLAFFGGDLLAPLRMLQHGAGGLLTTLWVAPMALALWAFWKSKKYLLPRNVSLTTYGFIVMGLLGGLFGYSTMTVALPGLALLGVLKLEELFQENAFSETYSPIAKEDVAPGEGAL